MDHRYGLLPINPKATLVKLVSHNRLVHRFEQTWTIGAMNLEGNINNLLCYFVFGHGTRSISRKGAKERKERRVIPKLKIPAAATVGAPFLRRTSSRQRAADDATSAVAQCT